MTKNEVKQQSLQSKLKQTNLLVVLLAALLLFCAAITVCFSMNAIASENEENAVNVSKDANNDATGEEFYNVENGWSLASQESTFTFSLDENYFEWVNEDGTIKNETTVDWKVWLAENYDEPSTPTYSDENHMYFNIRYINQGTGYMPIMVIFDNDSQTGDFYWFTKSADLSPVAADKCHIGKFKTKENINNFYDSRISNIIYLNIENGCIYKCVTSDDKIYICFGDNSCLFDCGVYTYRTSLSCKLCKGTFAQSKWTFDEHSFTKEQISTPYNSSGGKFDDGYGYVVDSSNKTVAHFSNAYNKETDNMVWLERKNNIWSIYDPNNPSSKWGYSIFTYGLNNNVSFDDCNIGLLACTYDEEAQKDVEFYVPISPDGKGSFSCRLGCDYKIVKMPKTIKVKGTVENISTFTNATELVARVYTTDDVFVEETKINNDGSFAFAKNYNTDSFYSIKIGTKDDKGLFNPLLDDTEYIAGASDSCNLSFKIDINKGKFEGYIEALDGSRISNLQLNVCIGGSSSTLTCTTDSDGIFTIDNLPIGQQVSISANNDNYYLAEVNLGSPINYKFIKKPFTVLRKFNLNFDYDTNLGSLVDAQTNETVDPSTIIKLLEANMSIDTQGNKINISDGQGNIYKYIAQPKEGCIFKRIEYAPAQTSNGLAIKENTTMKIIFQEKHPKQNLDPANEDINNNTVDGSSNIEQANLNADSSVNEGIPSTGDITTSIFLIFAFLACCCCVLMLVEKKNVL